MLSDIYVVCGVVQVVFICEIVRCYYVWVRSVVFVSAGGLTVCCVVVAMAARLKAWHKHATFCYKIPFVGWPWRVNNVSEWTVLPTIKDAVRQETLIGRTWIPQGGTFEFRQVINTYFRQHNYIIKAWVKANATCFDLKSHPQAKLRTMKFFTVWLRAFGIPDGLQFVLWFVSCT